MARQLALPIRCDQTKSVPSLRAPDFGEPVFFKDNVVNTPLLQKIAGGETCLSAANHDDGEVLLRRRGADRFHDGLNVSAHEPDGG